MNVEPKHTPGPWIDCHDHVDDSKGLILFRSMRTFAALNPLDFKLAAAAPDLLESCRAIIMVLEDIYPSASFRGGVVEFVLMRGRQAIAKATDTELSK